MNISTTEILLAQVRSYLLLARVLKSHFYVTRARATLELLKVELENKTAILAVAC